ncbi:MAG: PQQ-dependent sugar dehydrogenase [Verrucomicrobia bacterium]|nr:PQQ-dependent sugar dehydrogenase [Verrucomicrobiota bacterium]
MTTSRAFSALALCLAASAFISRASAADVSLQLVTTNLTAPIVLVPFDDKGRLLLAEQPGLIHVLARDGSLKPFLDLKERTCQLNIGKFDERGVLGVAMHPKFSQNGKFYVCFSAPKRAGAPEPWDHTMRVSEFHVKAGDRDTADAASERVVIEIDEPYFNHNGGRIAFGPDGFLYIGTGDGGHFCDINKNDSDHARGPRGNGQDVNVLLGKFLRIDVDKAGDGRNYGIPLDNPFAKGGGRTEIFAWGISNPWGFSFDRGGKHELFSADVGQSRWEEVNIIARGGNYGWKIKEGRDWFNPKKELAPLEAPYTDPLGAKFVDPIIAYENLAGFPKDGKGRSITGGYVYRGKALPQLAGKYIFADWSRNMGLPQGVLFAATRPATAGEPWKVEQLEVASHAGQHIGMYVWAFGEDADGELYVLSNQNNGLAGKTGKVWKLVKSGS